MAPIDPQKMQSIQTAMKARGGGMAQGAKKTTGMGNVTGGPSLAGPAKPVAGAMPPKLPPRFNARLAAGMAPATAQNRYAQFKAGQLPGQQPQMGRGRMPYDPMAPGGPGKIPGSGGIDPANAGTTGDMGGFGAPEAPMDGPMLSGDAHAMPMPAPGGMASMSGGGLQGSPGPGPGGPQADAIEQARQAYGQRPGAPSGGGAVGDALSGAGQAYGQRPGGGPPGMAGPGGPGGPGQGMPPEILERLRQMYGGRGGGMPPGAPGGMQPQMGRGRVPPQATPMDFWAQPQGGGGGY